jgi:hypothetical protein
MHDPPVAKIHLDNCHHFGYITNKFDSQKEKNKNKIKVKIKIKFAGTKTTINNNNNT